jgi:hypothetical protein
MGARLGEKWREELCSENKGSIMKTKDRMQKLLQIGDWIEDWVACQCSVTLPTYLLTAVKVFTVFSVFSAWARGSNNLGPQVLWMVVRSLYFSI